MPIIKTELLMKKIDGHARTIKLLLSHAKYGLDYYQREYKWERRQVEELLQDLEQKFLLSYEEAHDRTEVQAYERYFLGSIIVSERTGQRFLIDGQQRLTTLTLLLIYLNNLQKERPERVSIDHLIYSETFGKKSFNLDVEDRRNCLEALFTEKPFNTNNQIEAVQNLAARYEDISELFPDKLKGTPLLRFIDWLIECVDLIEITTSSDDDAYTIFETMNDRGLRLSPTDMLKGYLLANISDPELRRRANEVFKTKVDQLRKMGEDEDLSFFRDWLRAKYASTMRERKKDAEDQDFEKIATAFHRWVKENGIRIGLKNGQDFFEFILSRITRFTDLYIWTGRAAEKLTPGLEFIYYNQLNNLTLQYPLMLAPIRLEDSDDVAAHKMALVAGYLDIFAARRMVNFRTLAYSSIVYTMFNLMKEIPDLEVGPLATLLAEKVSAIDEDFSGIDSFSLHQQNRNRKSVHYLLARMTYHIEQETGSETSFEKYVSRSIKKPFEVEHIWSDKYEHHNEEFPSEQEFSEYRNRFGGLLLLQRGFNQSFGAEPYKEKLPHYFAQNLLARTLSPMCYQKNPNFLNYRKSSGLPFKSHLEFKKADLDTRQHLYREICEQLWSPARFDQIAKAKIQFPESPLTKSLPSPVKGPVDLATGGYKIKSAIHNLYAILIDENWHPLDELKKVAGDVDLNGRLARIRKRGKRTGQWLLEQKQSKVRLRLA
jgi:uncharacterized protein with ParB-like and HNH nuclease domain